MAHAKPKRSERSGRFESKSPLDDVGFLTAAIRYVRGVDLLVPLLQFMLGRLDQSSAEWRRLKMVHVLLDGMASAVAGQLVDRGERLMFGRPPSVDVIASAFESGGAADEGDSLELCLQWCRAVDDILWYFEAVGVVGSKKAQKLLGDVLGDVADHEDALMMLTMYAVRDALGGLRSRMVDRLAAAEDGYHLGESKKPMQRLQMPVHRLLGARALELSK